MHRTALTADLLPAGQCNTDPCDAGEICYDVDSSDFGDPEGPAIAEHECLCEARLGATSSDVRDCTAFYTNDAFSHRTGSGCAACNFGDSFTTPTCNSGYIGNANEADALADADCCSFPTYCIAGDTSETVSALTRHC